MAACAINFVAKCHIFFVKQSIPVRCLLPLLHHHTTSLELSQVAKHSAFIGKFIARECSHQYPRTRLADRAGRSDKLVDIVNGVSGVESGRKACSVTESDLQSDSRLRLIHVWLRGLGGSLARRSSSRSRRCCGDTRCRAPESESLSGERLVLGLGFHVFFLVLLDLHIHLLASLHIHYRKGSASLSNSVENLCVPCIVRAVQVSIVDREAI